MTVIRPNSVSGINSITAQANEIKIFKSDGTQGGLVIGGANLNATSGISTVAALAVTGNVSVGGTLTYQDVTNIDSVGIITARAGVHVTGGNVAVGHNNPSVNLHVKGSASNGQIYLGGTGAHSQIYADNDGVLILNADQGNSAANSYLGFNVDNTERVRIDSSGNMQVSTGQFTVGTTASTGLQLINDGTFGTIQSADLKIRTAATERLRITSAGLVGVNCTPLAQFQVKSGTNQNIALSSMSSEAAIEAFNDAGSANVPLRLRGEDFKFYTSSTERVRINQNGCLQVGSPSGTPSHLMEIRTASGDPEVIAYAPTGQKTIFNCTGSNRFALERGYNSVFEIQDPNGNGVRSDLRFDGNIILNKSMGDTNNSAVQLYRLIGPQNLSLGSGMAILGNQTDTMSTKAARITTSNSNGTAWFGPYGTIHPGSYTAMFHMKVSNNSNTSTIIRIDVSGQGITDAGGYGVHRPRVLNLAPSHFDNSDRYQYVGLDFNFVNPVATNVIEVRGLNFNNSRGADLYLDHILIVPRIPSHDG